MKTSLVVISYFILLSSCVKPLPEHTQPSVKKGDTCNLDGYICQETEAETENGFCEVTARLTSARGAIDGISSVERVYTFRGADDDFPARRTIITFTNGTVVNLQVYSYDDKPQVAFVNNVTLFRSNQDTAESFRLIDSIESKKLAKYVARPNVLRQICEFEQAKVREESAVRATEKVLGALAK